MKLTTFCLLAMTVCRCTFAADLLPAPRSVEMLGGEVRITKSTTLCYDSGLRDAALYIEEYLPLAQLSNKPVEEDFVYLHRDTTLLGEHYRLVAADKGITITAGTYDGTVRGIQTLLQLLPAQVYERRNILPAGVPQCRIDDSPAYAYRGFMLDVARTWIPADKVKRIIDLVAYHKINKLHWHLADDEGWRIEIKSHPELADVGGFRGGSSVIPTRYGKFGERWGGYYTQSQIRDIVHYAAVRGIEIIPELDLPGHSRTLAMIHPEVLCNYSPDVSVSNGRDIRNVVCASKESNYALLDDVLREICELFPSPHIHIGGDEVNKQQWESCPDCRATMRRHGMQNAHQLQDYFMSRLDKILVKYGKQPAVWNESIKGGSLPKSTLVYGWQSVKACLEATEKGYRTIVMPGEYFYLDMRQSPHEAGHKWAGMPDLHKTYSFDLNKCGFSAEQMQHVAGLECTFFSEIFIAHSPEDTDYLEYMMFPRLCAMAELAWSGKNATNSSYDEFYASLIASHFPRMNAMGIRYRLEPVALRYADKALTASVGDGSKIYYSRDGGEVKPYRGAIDTAEPQLYSFCSRLGTAYSQMQGTRASYEGSKPAVHLTSSMPFDPKTPVSNVEQYTARHVATTRSCRAGDWVLYTFDEPVECRKITIHSGHVHLARNLIAFGTVEISSDGVHFERVGELHEGAAVVRPAAAVKAVRITATDIGDAEPSILIQPLLIQ